LECLLPAKIAELTMTSGERKVGLSFRRLAVLAGAELFTRNSLIVLSACCHRSSWRGVLRNCVLVYFFSMAWPVLVALLIFGAIDRQFVMRYDKKLMSFFNVNTPDDLVMAV